MHILFSSDNNYVPHLGALIDSIFRNRQEDDRFMFHIVSYNISQQNKDNLVSLCDSCKNDMIEFIDFEPFVNSLELNMAWPISLSSYARLFVADMVPQDVSRIIYLDCDMIVTGPLGTLWNYDLGERILGAVQDQVPMNTKSLVGLTAEAPYFNAGMLLIDLEKWREKKMTSRCMDYIRQHQGRVMHHDQGVLNGLLKDSWLRLPLKYNVMTIHYTMGQKKIQQLYRDCSGFYCDEEIKNAVRHPLIIHFTPSFTSHPWCRTSVHPLKWLYWNHVKFTPWGNRTPAKDNTKWYVRVINWYYRVLYLAN